MKRLSKRSNKRQGVADGGLGSVCTVEALESRLLLSGVQIVTPAPLSQFALPGEAVVVDVNYTTDPLNENLTGLGLKVYFDSTQLEFVSLSGILPHETMNLPAIAQDDTQNDDGDSATDQLVAQAWLDFGLPPDGIDWPGTLPALLSLPRAWLSAT